MASRALGEGVILKVLKRFAFINDNKLGKIYFPIDANLSTSCSDMRERFKEGEKVLFSAQKQVPPKNDCSFTACSVIKPNELVTVEGVIITVSEKFAYAKTEKLGRVFMPFSARTKNNEAWSGSGADENARVVLEVMPQTPFNDCQYIAYKVSVLDADNATRVQAELLDLANARETTLECPLSTQSHTKLERQPDRVDGQIGIVVASNDREAYVYSLQTGMCYLSARSSGIKKMDVYFPTGSWATYDVIKKPSSITNIRCSWIGTNIAPYDSPADINSSYERQTKILTILNGYGIVCRVNEANRCAWLWNDHIGRIYVNSSDYQRAGDFEAMRSFDIVRFSATFKGAFEDVPWTAYDIVKIRDKSIEDCAKMLVTDDNWKILYVKPQPHGAFFGFMDHETYGSAFFAWTDTAGDQVPSPNTLCRVSAYKQYRDTKHRWRAVLVTPCNARGQLQFDHPKWIAPTPKVPVSAAPRRPPFQVAVGSSKPSTTHPTPPGLEDSIAAMSWPAVHAGTKADRLQLGVSLSQQYNQQNYYRRIEPLNSSEGLERELDAVDWDDEPDHPPTNGSHHAFFDEKKTSSSRSSEIAAPVSRNRSPPGFEFASPSALRMTSGQTNDQMTQTDPFNEHIILRDIINDSELLAKIITKFPHLTERILGIQWKI